MSRILRVLLWLAAGSCVALSVGPVDPAAAAAPSVAPATATPAIGEWLPVDVAGFSPGPVQLELCAVDGAAGTSTACDLAGAGQVAVGADGRGSGLVQVAQPPVPCPCVMLARSLGTGESAEAPVELGGGDAVPAAPPVAGSDDPVAAPDEGQLALAARFTRPTGVGQVLSRFFGWETTLAVDIGTANLGERAVGATTTEIWASSADRPTPRRVGALDLPALPAGDRGSVRTEIVLSGPVLTPTTIWLRPYGVGPSQTLTTVVSDRSWGLIALTVVVFALALVLAGRVGHGLVSAVVNRKRPRRAPRRTGWRPSLVAAAAALAVVAAAVVVQGISEDRAAAAHWAGRRADAIIAAGARPATPTIALPTPDGEAHWRIQPGVGPAALTGGVGRWPGPYGASLLVGIADQPAAPFARLGDLRTGEVVVLRATDGATTTYKITSVRRSPAGAPVPPGAADELILWGVASGPATAADTVVRAEAVR